MQFDDKCGLMSYRSMHFDTTVNKLIKHIEEGLNPSIRDDKIVFKRTHVQTKDTLLLLDKSEVSCKVVQTVITVTDISSCSYGHPIIF